MPLRLKLTTDDGQFIAKGSYDYQPKTFFFNLLFIPITHELKDNCEDYDEVVDVYVRADEVLRIDVIEFKD